MLFWMCLVILIVGILLIIASYIKWDYRKNKLFKFLYKNDDNLRIIGSVTTFLSGLTMAIMLIILYYMYTGIDAEVVRLKETYKAITYKIESGACRDEFGILNEEVIDEIQSWNVKIIYNQKIQNNFWVGIFYPDVYDQFKIIDYKKYGRE